MYRSDYFGKRKWKHATNPLHVYCRIVDGVLWCYGLYCRIYNGRGCDKKETDLLRKLIMTKAKARRLKSELKYVREKKEVREHETI